jgi:hypothetical protein
MSNREMSEQNATALLGHLLDAGALRDAIHIAVAPVVATEWLLPGQDIGFAEDGDTEKVGAHAAMFIGIVDPFLRAPVQVGQRCWVFLYPMTITSLRHQWTHPAFGLEGEPTSAKARAEARLREIAARLGITVEGLMDAAEFWLAGEREKSGEWNGNYTVEHGSEHWRNTFQGEMVDDFWRQYEIVRGTAVKAESKQAFFSCSC